MPLKFRKNHPFAEKPRISLWRKILAGAVLGSAVAVGGKMAVDRFHQSPKFVWEAMAEQETLQGFSQIFKMKKEDAIKTLKQFAQTSQTEFERQKMEFRKLPNHQQQAILERLEKQANHLCKIVGEKENISPRFLKAIYRKETSFISASVGATEDIGGGQFTPATLYDMHTKIGFEIKNPFNAHQSLIGIAKLLKYRETYLQNKPLYYEGKILSYSQLSEEQQMMLLARAYNAGPGSIVSEKNQKKDNTGRNGFDITPILNRDILYPRAVMDYYHEGN